jgi:hypothetical protein
MTAGALEDRAALPEDAVLRIELSAGDPARACAAAHAETPDLQTTGIAIDSTGSGSHVRTFQAGKIRADIGAGSENKKATTPGRYDPPWGLRGL